MKSMIIRMLMLCLCAMAAPAYSGTVLPDLNPLTVDTTGASVDSSSQTVVKFVNQLASAVDIYWIDYAGNRVFYGTLGAGSEAVQPTFLTHPWLVVLGGTGGDLTQGSGTLWTAFVAQTAASWTSGDYDIAYIREVPESGTLALLGLGLAGLGLSRRRKAN